MLTVMQMQAIVESLKARDAFHGRPFIREEILGVLLDVAVDEIVEHCNGIPDTDYELVTDSDRFNDAQGRANEALKAAGL